MPYHLKSDYRRIFHTTIIVALACWAIFFDLAKFRGLLFLPPGDFGLTTDTRLIVTSTDPQQGAPYSGATKAGVRVGDVIDGNGVSFTERLHLIGVYNPSPGTTMNLRVWRGNAAHRVALTAIKAQYGSDQTVFYVLVSLVGLIFTVVGAAVVFFRSSVMTWAFFLGCLGLQQGLYFYMYWLSAPLVFAAENFFYVIYSAGYAGMLIFAARLPDNRSAGFGRLVEFVAPLVFVTLLIALILSNIPYPIPNGIFRIADKLQYGVVWIWPLVLLTLLASLVSTRDTQRWRVAWIFAGFTLAFGARIVKYSLELPGDFGEFWLPSLQAAIPLSVAYAVIRHRAFQAGVLANRAIVYGLLLSVIFCMLALLDWIATRRFVDSPFNVGIVVALAIAFGYILQAFHRRATRLIDRVFFHRRYETTLALERLHDSIGALPLDETRTAAFAQEVAHALGVFSVAFFRRTLDGGFVRYSASGWDRTAAWHLLPQDEYVRGLDLRRSVIPLSTLEPGEVPLPSGAPRPTVGITVSSKGRVEHLVLVSDAASGGEPDHDSLRMLGSIVAEIMRHGPLQSA